MGNGARAKLFGVQECYEVKYNITKLVTPI
jgi:hypothetical protein